MKVQSKVEFTKGTIVYDEDTGEIFEVVECIKFFMQELYGLTLQEQTK